jgi:hypothetical protein
LHHTLPAWSSVVTPKAHGTECPVALVTVQVTMPVGCWPVLGVTSGVTRPVRPTPLDVRIGFALADMATVVGKAVAPPAGVLVAGVSSTWLELDNIAAIATGPPATRVCASGAASTTATGVNAAQAANARKRLRKTGMRYPTGDEHCNSLLKEPTLRCSASPSPRGGSTERIHPHVAQSWRFGNAGRGSQGLPPSRGSCCPAGNPAGAEAAHGLSAPASFASSTVSRPVGGRALRP